MVSVLLSVLMVFVEVWNKEHTAEIYTETNIYFEHTLKTDGKSNSY